MPGPFLISTEPPSLKRKSSRPVPVSNGFLALPVLLASDVEGIREVVQHVFVRRKDDESNEEEGNRTLFAVNIPYGSSEDSVRKAFDEILRVRRERAKVKGASQGGSRGVETVELITTRAGGRSRTTLLETEGITDPASLLEEQETAEQEKQTSKKGKKKARQAQEVEQKTEKKPSIHPLFLSSDLSLSRALQHLQPSPSTLKAHVTFSSLQDISLLLSITTTTTSFPLTVWPSSPVPVPEVTTDEAIYALSRPSLSTVKLHTDDWMRHFDSLHPPSNATASTSANLDDVPKSKRALAREAVARTKALSELERKKAIRNRRIYDDDFLPAEADPEGWVTVSRGGKYGRSKDDENVGGGEAEAEAEVTDEEELRQAEREGFVSGKRSVGVASREFVVEQERLKTERKREIQKLEARIGAGSGFVDDDDDNDINDDGLSKSKEGEDDSRGSGRGRKKKKTGGYEMAMYGFNRKYEQSKSGLLSHFHRT